MSRKRCSKLSLIYYSSFPLDLMLLLQQDYAAVVNSAQPSGVLGLMALEPSAHNGQSSFQLLISYLTIGRIWTPSTAASRTVRRSTTKGRNGMNSVSGLAS